jgi:hypothetical protein
MTYIRVTLSALLLLATACAGSPRPEPHAGVAKRWGGYLSMPHQRAFAMAGDPNGHWLGSTVGGYGSPAEAKREALRRCEHERAARRMEAPCRIYAVGHQIVWDDPQGLPGDARTDAPANPTAEE